MSEEISTNKIRISKFLSECGVASRRASEELISEGKVKVNDRTVTDLAFKIDPDYDQIRVRNKIVKPPDKGVVLFHKPKGVVSTLSDPQGRPCIGDFMHKTFKSYFPVGRLDWDTTGLVILTNDGELGNILMHPRYGFEKTYQVKVSGVPTEKTLRRIERGITLQDGPAKAKVKVMSMEDDSAWLELTITEGRNRLIRRLMDIIRHPVQKLKRISHGPFKLGKLKTGEIRKLPEEDYKKAKKIVIKQVESNSKEREQVKKTAKKRHK